MPDLVAFDTEDDSKRFSDANQDHPGWEKVCTQIAAIDARTGERFHMRPRPAKGRRRGRWQESDWDTTAFLQWLEDRGPGVRVYAHNLAYDIGNIWRNRLDDLDVTMVGNRLVRARWKNLTLLDSSNMWPMPLAKVGKSVGLEKMEFAPDSEEYVFRDVEIVVKAMEVAERVATEFGADIKGTLGSMAVAIWNGPVIGGSNWQCAVPEIREAYYGGRVELFRPELRGDDLWYTDINSLYPSVMLNEFPDSADLWFGEDDAAAAERLLRDFKAPLWGVVRVDVTIPTGTLLAPLPVRRPRSGEVCFPVGPVSGWWTVHEVRNAMRMGASLDAFHEAFGSRTATACYADFVRTFYRLRKEELDKPEPDEGKTLFYKLLMNNLYGQLGMRGEVTRSVTLKEDMVEPDEDGNLILTRPGIPFGSKLLTDIAMPLPAHVNYLHAAYVTSYARLRLLRFMEMVGPGRLAYCDTDSMFFRWAGDKPPFPLSTELGEMKLEDRPRVIQCRSPKMYRLTTGKGEVRTKAKGVTRKMQDTFYDEGVASFWQPWRLKESVSTFDRLGDEQDEDVKGLGVWRRVTKRVVSGYDKKRLVRGMYVPKTMVDIGPGDGNYSDLGTPVE